MLGTGFGTFLDTIDTSDYDAVMPETPLTPESMTRVTLRLPDVLAQRLYEARGKNSLNAEIVNRLAASFVGRDGRTFAVEPEPPVGANGFVPPPRSAEVAAGVPGVVRAGDLAKEAKPFGKRDQAGGGK